MVTKPTSNNTKRGTCLEVIKNGKVMANSYYNYIEQKYNLLNLLYFLIHTYNKNKLYNYTDHLFSIVSFLEYRGNDVFPWDDNQGELRTHSKDIMKMKYPDKTFNESIEQCGLIGITEQDISLNENLAKHLVSIDMDKNQIIFKDYHITAIEKSLFEKQYSHIKIEELDELDIDLCHFFFYELEELISFYDKHFGKKELTEKFFTITNQPDYIFSLL